VPELVQTDRPFLSKMSSMRRERTTETDQTSEILNLSNFDLEGMTFKINTLQVEAGQLTLQARSLRGANPLGLKSR